jgi:N-acetylglucosaminyl-diphospho-decaprenol L-rhamnosyltransferase
MTGRGVDERSTGVAEDGAAASPVDCAIVVVTHNSEAHILRFLESVEAAAGRCTWRVVVVDNASSDGTAAAVSRFPAARFIQAGANRGYAAGINLGRRSAAAFATLLVANPDVCLAPGALEMLYQALTQAEHGAVFPKLLGSDGRTALSLRREPTVGRQLGEALLGDRLRRRPSWLSEIVRDEAAYDRPHAVEWATGAVVMVSARCDELVGDWDESYFLFSEETDYASRVRKAGLSLAYVPQAVAVHEQGGSGPTRSLMGLVAINRLRYYRRRHGSLSAFAFGWAVMLELMLRFRQPEHRTAARHLLPVLPQLAFSRELELPPSVAASLPPGADAARSGSVGRGYAGAGAD